MPIIVLDGLDDTRVSAYQLVRDPELVRRKGLFIAEGRLVVERLLEAAAAGQHTVESLLVSDTALVDVRPLLDGLPNVPVFVCHGAAFRQLAGLNLHRGCLALARRPPTRATDVVLDAARRVVVLEAVGNPDNVGGIFRNAAAFAVDGVLLAPGCADPFYRKAIRTSMGATLRVPFADLSPWPAALRDLKARGFFVVALTPAPSAHPLAIVATRPLPARTALLLGNEGDGLSAGALAEADLRVCIPMAGAVDSLNVAVASGIALSWLSPDPELASGLPGRYTRTR